MTEKEFYDFVFHRYQPSKYEQKELTDPRFKEGTNYSHICKTRSYLIYKEVYRNIDHFRSIVDFGFFPGTILRQLKMIFDSKIRFFGVGLNIDDAFRDFMSTVLDGCFDVEFDPFYGGLSESIHLPMASNSVDVVIATEVLEHLISPLEMVSEGARILSKGGIFIVTTPNVSHIGAIMKLLLGKSNYERLDRSPMYMKTSQWRGHIRFYDKEELATLFSRFGLALTRHRYYREKGWDHAHWPILKIAATRFVDIFFPLYREGHFAVFQKR
jgi:SAM-dependent methyltransferase